VMKSSKSGAQFPSSNLLLLAVVSLLSLEALSGNIGFDGNVSIKYPYFLKIGILEKVGAAYFVSSIGTTA
jgi:hypothetical protein